MGGSQGKAGRGGGGGTGVLGPASATFTEIQTGEPSYSALRKTTIPIYADKSPLFSFLHTLSSQPSTALRKYHSHQG